MKREITKKSAVLVMAYLMISDGTVSDEERSAIEEIGRELDPENFGDYKDVIINACESLVRKETAESRESITNEAVTVALQNRVETVGDGIMPRLLLWNMIVLGHSDGEYDSAEKKLIRKVADLLQVQESIVLEMEQLMKTSVVIERDLAELSLSEEPYVRIRPIVDEIETRRKNVMAAALDLIADDEETVTSDELIPEREDGVLETAGKQIGATVAPLAETAGTLAKSAFDSTAEAVGGAASKVASGVLSGVGSLFGKK